MPPGFKTLQQGEKGAAGLKVEGRVRASSIRKISDLVDQHPEQAVNLIRQWIYAEQ